MLSPICEESGNGANGCNPSFGEADHGFHQPGRDRQDVPDGQVRAVLAETGKTSLRQRELPAHVMVYYVIALALFMNASCREVLRCLLEGLQWLKGALDVDQGDRKIRHFASAHAARRRGGAPAARRDGAADRDAVDQGRLVQALAAGQSRRQHARRPRRAGAGGRLRSAGRRPRRKRLSANPLRLPGGERHACLVRNPDGGLRDQRDRPDQGRLVGLAPGMLCLADRNFFGYEMWRQRCATGADLLWRIKTNARLPCEERSAGRFVSEPHLSLGNTIDATRPMA